MFTKEETRILQIIKFVPPVLIIITSALVALLLYKDHITTLKKETAEFKEYFIEKEKLRVQGTNTVVLNYLKVQNNKTETSLKNTLKSIVHNLHSTMNSIYNRYHKTHSDQEITEMIKSAFRDIRFFDGRSYLTLVSLDGYTILQPLRPHKEGDYVYELKDSRGNYIIKDAIKVVASDKKEGYTHYFFPKLSDKKNEYEKITFHKLFEPLRIYISVGEYAEDYVEDIKRESIKHINNLKYPQGEYIAVLTKEGTFLAHEDKARLRDNVYTTPKHAKAQKNFDAILKAIEDKEKFVTYNQVNKPGFEGTHTKISHVAYFEEWDWILINGFHVDNATDIIDKKIQSLTKGYNQRINTMMLFVIFLTLFLLAISFILSNHLKKIFIQYKTNIESTLEKNLQQKQHLIKAQEVANIGNWELDKATMKVYWSDEMIKIMGLENIEFTPGPEFLCTLMHKDDHSCFKDAMRGAIEKDKEYITQYRITRPDGQMRWIECRGQTDNAKNKVYGTFQDITDLKEKDEFIIAQSRHAAMGEMISMIAHQWRQPLTTISMQANNLLLDIDLNTLSEEDTKKYAHKVLENTQNLSKTIDDFRNFFKPDKALVSCTLNEVMDETLSMMGDSLKANDVSLHVTNNSTSPLLIHERELMQVFMNILNNAKDALSQQKSIERHIDVLISEDETHVSISFQDNAGGIPEEILSKIFDPYFSTKDEKTGTGIGLYMSKIIVEEHLHGSLNVSNEQDGAVFTVSLPKQDIPT